MKQSVQMNFSGGLDTKTDPFQIQAGKFLSLVNSVFTVGKRLTKRNGFGILVSPPSSALYATTFKEDLTLIGTNIQAYSASNESWVTKGTIIPVSLSTLPLIRNNLNQIQTDTAIAPNGLICTVYTEQNNGLNTYKYAVADSVTGQNFVAPAAISAADPVYGTPRVFVLGNYFIVVFVTTVSNAQHLVFFSIGTSSFTVSSVVPISTDFSIIDAVPFDGVVFNNKLYLAWQGATTLRVANINTLLNVSSALSKDTSNTANSYVSVCSDSANSIIWVSYYSFSVGAANCFAMDINMNTVLAATSILTGNNNLQQITSSAQNNILTFIYDQAGTYGFNNSISTDTVFYQTITIGGTVGSSVTISLNIGLGSKSFIYNGVVYFLASYGSQFQDSYFLMNTSGNILAKLAYGNGGGYYDTSGFLPSVSLTGSIASISYLFKDLIEPVNKNTSQIISGGINTSGTYTQTGINVCAFNIASSCVSVETGLNLNITGGFLWAYDGFIPVEQNFFLWPEYLSASASAAVTPTGNTTSGSPVITSISSMAYVAVGCTISGTGIASSSVIIAINTANSTVTLNKNATGNHSGVTLTITGALTNTGPNVYWYQGIYEWSDNQGNIFRSAPSQPISLTPGGASYTARIYFPYLRLTYKTANPVKLILYRYSVAQPVYYQVTSITAPVLNSTTSDYATIYDGLADSAILGNDILYTNGGAVLEDIGPPSFKSIFTFDDRLWGIPAEDQDLLWFSKQIVESEPVEMSDLLTFYLAQSIGAQGPTGTLNCGAAMDDKLILWKDSAIFYINGTGPDISGNNSQYSATTFITSMVGCSNQKSIIFQPNGLMFEFSSESGNQIWIVKRDLSTEYIGFDVEALTKNATVLSALSVPGTTEVRFNMSSGITLKYDYLYGQWGVHSTNAISSTLFEGLHTYIGANGFIYQETPGEYLDGTQPVLLSFITGWINAAGIRGYERIHEISFLGTYLSPQKSQVQLAFDYGSPYQQSTFTPSNFAGTYGTGIYGSGAYGGPGNIENFRVFAKKQKCKAFQVVFNEIYDPSFGVAAGGGINLSGMNFVMTLKKEWSPISGKNSVG